MRWSNTTSKETPSIRSIKIQEHNHQLTKMDRFLKSLDPK